MRTRCSVLEVNLDNFLFNVDSIKKYIGKDIMIMPVIKANAYGTYINKRLDIINRFDIVAVALIKEAVDLRELGYEKEIFVLNQPYLEDIDDIIKYDITIGISDKDFVLELGKRKENVKVHIEIDSGMGRTGVLELSSFIDEVRKCSNIKVEGIYTHLSSADSDYSYTDKQLDIFERCILEAKKYFDLKYIHSSASNGLLNFKSSYCNLVRPGIILYGYESFDGAKKLLDLKPVCKLKSKITFLKEVEEGTSISYSRSYITNKKTKVATIPLGYADGIRRSLSNKGFVVINNSLAPIIGNICMDSFMIDVTGLDVNVSDDIYIFDNENIKVEDIASIYETINYEVISTIADRVPRLFIGG